MKDKIEEKKDLVNISIMIIISYNIMIHIYLIRF